MTIVMNRNIITKADIAQMSAATTAGDVPKTLDAKPPAASATQAAPGGVVGPSEDDYITKLLKYIPIEILGAYLFMQTIVNSNVTTSHAHAIWLLCLLIGAGVLTFAYDRWVLSILRLTQLLMSVLAFAVYVFAMGGWFETTGWYHQWYGSIAVPTFVVLVGIIPVKPLPTPNSAPGSANSNAPTTSATDSATATATATATTTDPGTTTATATDSATATDPGTTTATDPGAPTATKVGE
jgi:hypothetical protein